MSNTTEQPVEHFRELLQSARPALPGADLAWLESQRDDAVARLGSVGFPTRKHEAWRYTSLDGLLKQPLSIASELFVGLTEDDIADLYICTAPAARLVFCNGRLIETLSSRSGLPEGVRAVSLRDMLQQEPEKVREHLGRTCDTDADIFAAMNTALIDDGLWLELDAGVEIETPIEILSLAVHTDTSPAVSPRNLVVLNPGARATLVEQHACLGPSNYFTNSVTEIRLHPEARLEHYRLQDESPEAFHKAVVAAQLDRASDYSNISLSLGARWARTDCQVKFRAEQASCRVDGLYFAGDGQLGDFHLDIDHAVPRCTSQERFKGILAGKGRAVFEGRVRVAADAQKTAAHLKNDNLLLSRDAEIDTKPQLEIYADDVQCSHGTTVGQIDDQQLFYLRSRGIDQASAKRMLCQGFANEILEPCNAAEFVAYAEQAIAKRL